MRPAIVFKNAKFGYLGKTVLEVGDLTIENGITCLLGPNGAGKTTFIRGITGVLMPMQGEVAINGVNLFGSNSDDIRKKIGFLPENSYPYPNMSVEEYLTYWAEFYGVSTERVNETLSMMKIDAIKSKMGHSLSQGQKRRVMIARMLLSAPEIMVLDEPTANLDPDIAREVMDLIVDFGKRYPVIYSTHHLLEIEKIFDRIIFIKNGKILGVFQKEEVSGDIYEFYTKISGGD